MLWGHRNVPTSPVCHEGHPHLSGRRLDTGQRAAVVSVIFLVNPERSQNLQPTLGSATMSEDSLSRWYLPS